MIPNKMFLYNNSFLFRIPYLLFLIICNKYCLKILSIGYKAYFLKPTVTLNFISIFNGIIHVLNLNRSNYYIRFINEVIGLILFYSI